MKDDSKYYIVAKEAVPEVFLRVMEAKRLLDSKKVLTVQEATDTVGISRSSFYKYKDDIFPFHDNARGKNITFMMQMDDKPGVLACILNVMAKHNVNILTIHQSIPVNSIATLSLSADMLPCKEDVSEVLDEIEDLDGIHYLKILGRE